LLAASPLADGPVGAESALVAAGAGELFTELTE
jgi:hypothetical protein